MFQLWRPQFCHSITERFAHWLLDLIVTVTVGSFRSSEESARSSSGFAGPASGPLEIAPVLSAPQFLYSGFQPGEPNGWQAPPPYVPSPRVSAESQQSMPDTNIQLHLSQQQPLFTAARLNEHDAQLSAEQLSAGREASVLRRSESLQQQSESQGDLGTLRKSVSLGREPHTQKEALRALKQIQRSSSGSVAKLPNSLPGSLSDTDSGAFQRPTGALAEAGTPGRGSGTSTMSSSIFGGSYQWVIEYSDLVSAVEMYLSSTQLHLTPVYLIIQPLLLPCFSLNWVRASCTAAFMPFVQQSHAFLAIGVVYSALHNARSSLLAMLCQPMHCLQPVVNLTCNALLSLGF